MSKLYVVGIGPGKFEGMTHEAARALEASDVIVGYTVYVDLVKAHFPNKTFLTTPMRREVERVELALSEAAKGKTVAMVCSGDPGVYGMSGLCEELAAKYPGVAVETIPGVSAVLSGAAILGAPLMHDFAVISLSPHVRVPGHRLRRGAEHRPGWGEHPHHDPEGAQEHPGGYVLHRLYRQLSNEGRRGQNGDAPGVRP